MDKAQSSIDKYNYPWKTYIEISDKNRIWEKYGISNSGGAQFLINKDGIIVAIIHQLMKSNHALMNNDV